MSVLDSASQKTFHALYSDHHGWLQGWLRKKLGCSHYAADLAQDTFLRVMVSGRTPQPEQSRAHLTQIAKGLVIDMHRRRRLELAYKQALASLPEVQLPSPETQAIILETLIGIDAALSALPVHVRETFLLSQFEGLTYSQIAIRLNISVGAVRKYMLKAAQACFAVLNA